MTTVGERIHERRVALGLSLRDVGCEGASSAYVSRLEANARQPSVKALRKLASKLGVSVHWLETGENDPAEELARLVLKYRGGLMPPRAAKLARRVLTDTRSES